MTAKTRLLLIGYNFFPEPTGIGKYSGEMMMWLATNNYHCEVLTAYPYYPFWKIKADYYKKRFTYATEQLTLPSGNSILVHRCPMYVPSRPSGLKRILLDLSFLATAFLKLIQLLATRNFDVVVVIAPSFQFGLLGVFCKKLFNTTFSYHIQDLQIEAARDLGMIRSAAIIRALFKVERFIIRQADHISSISVDMVKKIQEKASKPVLLFPNWVDDQAFYPLADKSALKAGFGFAPRDIVVLYSGAIGEKQGLEYILQAAHHFQSQTAIKFLICGSGPYSDKLQALARTLALPNVVFLPLQPPDKFNQFLNMADIHLVIQKGLASDLVMPSKLTTILAVGGLAIVTANVGSGLHTLVDTHQMGILVAAEDQQALNEGIRRAIEEDNSRVTRNAQQYAQNYLAIEKVMQAFEAAVLKAE